MSAIWMTLDKAPATLGASPTGNAGVIAPVGVPEGPIHGPVSGQKRHETSASLSFAS